MSAPIAFGWPSILRLGLVQAAIGAMVMLSTSLLNRVMMVELGLAAAVPAGLVAWHYAVQLSRPVWGHGSDRGRRRTPWIVGGMGALALGTLVAVDAAVLMGQGSFTGYLLGALAYTMIGAGVGAAGTSLLALLAAGVAPEQRAPAAALTWVMMVAGIVVSAGTVGALIDPFSLPRLALITGGAVLIAFLVAAIAIHRIEPRHGFVLHEAAESFPDALRSVWSDDRARRFTAFVFVSMLAYSMQDLILEPFGGLVFRLSPGATTQLSGVHHGGVLIGMIGTGLLGRGFAGGGEGLQRWVVGGCLVSAVALAGLAIGARDPLHWPLTANLVLLGLGNGGFAAAAVASMMALAGADGPSRSGTRMGVWGAAQAVAFGLGGLLGAVTVDLLRAFTGADVLAFQAAFAGEGLLFLASSLLVLRIGRGASVARTPVPA